MSEHFHKYRRGYAGRGRGAPSTPALSSESLPPERSLREGLHPIPVKALVRPTSQEVSNNDIVVENLEYLGSFNWTNATKPTVIIPGCPGIWRDRSLPYRVRPDSGIRFVDQTGYRMPKYPLYPLVRAVEIMSEDKGDSFDWNKVDFVTDRNGLRKLLRWLNDTGTAKDFRIDTQLAGTHTVLLNRWEKKTREEPNPRYSTYGFSFERESTDKAPGLEHAAATGYHRIIKYDLDGLTMVVRFEVDACMPQTAGVSTQASRRQTDSTDLDSLSNMLSGLAVASDAGRSPQVDDDVSTSELSVIRAGQIIPQNSLIEMTTRSQNNAINYDWVEGYPQLFLSQTPHHFLAVHNRGEFQRIEKRNLSDLKKVDAQSQRDFRELRAALKTVQDLVVEHGERGRLSLVFSDGNLEVFERKSQASCLPEDVLNKFHGL